MIELFIAQYTVPYYPNIEKVKRWTYKAREHQMFTDLIVYDQARYLMDWLPTPEMLTAKSFDIQLELSIRYILDAFAKNNYYYLTNSLYLSAIDGNSGQSVRRFRNGRCFDPSITVHLF